MLIQYTVDHHKEIPKFIMHHIPFSKTSTSFSVVAKSMHTIDKRVLDVFKEELSVRQRRFISLDNKDPIPIVT